MLSVTVFPEIVTPETVLPVAIEPMEIPCPPEQKLFSKTMLVPELIATLGEVVSIDTVSGALTSFHQSSWL